MTRLPAVLVLMVITGTPAMVGCGSAERAETADTKKSAATKTTSAKVIEAASFSSCPGSRKSYETGQSMIEAGREGLAEGREVGWSRRLIRQGKETSRLASEGCALEEAEAWGEVESAKAKFCARTPAEMKVVAARGVDDPSLSEVVAAYELSCGKRVPEP